MNPLTRLKVFVNQLLPKASFARNVAVLAGGTTAAQAVGVLALPAITRFYTPEDFSVLAVYVSILGILVSVVCLRLDIAIPLPERDEVAANLLAIALQCCTAGAFMAALCVWLFPEQIANAVGQPGLRPFLWMIPLGIWLASAYSAIQFWATRKKRFTAIARTKIGQTTGSSVFQLAGGVLSTGGPFGLLLGQLIAGGAGVFGLGRTAWREDKKTLCKVNWREMRQAFQEYNRFPKYSTFEALTNSAAIELPILIIAAVALGTEAGYLFLAMRTMAIPVGLIGGAVSQVYLSRAAEEYREGQLGNMTLKAISGLMRTGGGPLIFAGIVAPFAFPLIFGDEWRRAGEMVTWMTPWFILQFVASPISMSLHVTNNQSKALFLQLFGFILRVGGTWLAAIFAIDYIFEIYAITGFVFYTVYLIVIAHVTEIKKSGFLSTVLASLHLIILWAVIGIVLIYAISYLSHL